jgi:hypothetical protein
MSQKPSVPPSSLARAAAVRHLEAMERFIKSWLRLYVIQHCKPKTPAIDLYIDAHFSDLWQNVPDDLRAKYAEAQARVNATSDWADDPAADKGKQPSKIKGRPGRPGYSQEIRDYALQLKAEQKMTIQQIFEACKKKFPKQQDNMPGSRDAFASWLNRKYKS